jgi:uncharacterized protein
MSVTTPGAFCWAELVTSDAEHAKRFYGELLNWTVRVNPSPQGDYLFFLADGKEVGAGYQGRAGVNPHWNVYFAVNDVDASTAVAEAAGAKTITKPFDAMDAGRLANFQDPQGALFTLWQARKMPGFMHQGVGAFCWAELATPDPVASIGFYSKFLPWMTKPETGLDKAEYIELSVGGRSFGGAMPMRGDMWKGVPPHWMAYVAVADCDERAAKAKQLGATVCVPPTDIPNVGRFSVLTDAQGATFSIIHVTGMTATAT